MLHKIHRLCNVLAIQSGIIGVETWQAKKVPIISSNTCTVKQIKVGISTAWNSENSYGLKNIFKWRCKGTIGNKNQILRNVAAIICRTPCNAPCKCRERCSWLHYLQKFGLFHVQTWTYSPTHFQLQH